MYNSYGLTAANVELNPKGDWLRHEENGRGDKIRTCDPLVPNQMRYQAALLPDWTKPLGFLGFLSKHESAFVAKYGRTRQERARRVPK